MAKTLDAGALTVKDLSKLLTARGAKLATVKNIRKDIKAGAPVNPDGSINIVHYIAWLVREVVARGD